MLSKVAVSIFVTNQQTARYPVWFLLKNLGGFDRIFVFGGSSIDTLLLKSEIERSGLSDVVKYKELVSPVNCPGDIAHAQNRCIDEVFGNSDTEFLVILQADNWLSPVGTKMIQEFVDSYKGNPNHFQSEVVHTRLYCRTDQEPFGCTLLHKSCTKRFVGDGAYLEIPYFVTGKVDDVYNVPVVGIGYLSTSAYFDKFRNHARLWQGFDQTHYCEKFLSDRKIAVTDELRRLRRKYCGHGPLFIPEVKGVYQQVIEGMDLRADYDFVKPLVDKVNRE